MQRYNEGSLLQRRALDVDDSKGISNIRFRAVELQDDAAFTVTKICP